LVARDEDDVVSKEGIWCTGFAGEHVGGGVNDRRGQEELIGKFRAPLFANRGGGNEEKAAVVRGPELGKNDAGLNGLAKADLVREERATGERGLESEDSCIDLVRVEVDLGT